MISKLQMQLNCFTAMKTKTKHSSSSQKLLEDVELPPEVELQKSTVADTRFHSSRSASDSADGQSIALELDCMPVHTHQSNRKSIISQSCNEAEQHRLLESVPLHPVYAEENSSQSETLSESKQVPSNGKTKRKKVKNCDLHSKNAPTDRKQSKTYTCKECNKQFTCKSQLTRYFRIHTGEKLYVCRICDASFNQSANLSTHLRIHTGQKPFVCDICKKSFRHKITLSEHMNIHSGNQPHKCKLCKKSFRQVAGLRSHHKVHHKE